MWPGLKAFDRRFEFYNGVLYPMIIEGPFVDQITPTSAIISGDTDLSVTDVTLNVSIASASSIRTVRSVKMARRPKSPPASPTHFEETLTGLTAGTTYYYSVQATDGTKTTNTRQYYFKTPALATTKFDFVAMGDARANAGGSDADYGGVNYGVVKQLFTNAFNRDVAFAVFTGDYEWGFSDQVLDLQQQLRAWKDATEQVRHYIPLYAAMGNHELSINSYYIGMTTEPGSQNLPYLWFDKPTPNSGEEVFAGEFVNPTNGPDPDDPVSGSCKKPPYRENLFYWDYGNRRFVVLNTAYWYSSYAEKYGGFLNAYIGDDQLAWLTNVFNQTAADPSIEHLFLFGHTPVFPSGGHEYGGMWLGGGSPAFNGGVDRTYVVERRDQLWQAFVNSGKAVAYVAADEHNYSRTAAFRDRNNNYFSRFAWQIVSGGAGAPLTATRSNTVPWKNDVKKFSTQYHSAMFKVDGKQVTVEVYNVDNQLIESAVLKNSSGVITTGGIYFFPWVAK
jgi:phosphodiesterase/alkaline phosphatase D-like protein